MARLRQDVMLGDRYRLERQLAVGGMGTVWVARDTVLDRSVAVKVLSEALGADERFVERFRREARASAGLSHPNIAGVYDYGEDGDTPFIVMELIDGENLAQRIGREGRIEPGEASRIAVDVADALQAAHEAGVIHRDVKPGNVMLDRAGRVRVMDFGIAAAAGAQPITATGTTLGTASYLSPEQASGERVTPASDVYALGCVLYEMLSGRPPFTGDSPVAVAAAHAHQTPVPIGELAPGVPEPLAAACQQALAKDPAARPASAADLARRLRSGAGPGGPPSAARTEPITPPERTAVLPSTPATPPAPPSPVRGPRRRPRAWFWGQLALLVVAAAAWAIVAALVGEPPRSPPAGPTPAVTPGATMPEVIGLPLRDARAALIEAGFEQARVVPTAGERGIVVDVDPPEGATVSPDQPVTLYVGVSTPKQDEGEDNGKDGKGKDGGRGPG